MPAQSPADQPFIGKGTVNIGGVEQGDPQFERVGEYEQGAFIVEIGGVVFGGHADAAEADRPD